jgi:hypothetical protein
VANNDLRGVRHFLYTDVDHVYVIPTAIIDYCGRRIVAQWYAQSSIHCGS